jgi:RNA recognition motif-containing protein
MSPIFSAANPNKCRGFGYVTFALNEDAIQAQQKIRQINGRKLFITFSNKKPRHIQRGHPEKKTDEAKGSKIVWFLQLLLLTASLLRLTV